MLVRLARQAELGLGQKLEKESHGRKLLLVRHPLNGSVSAMDAHCFHQGAALVGGDIEDVDGRACVVCPAHRYRIDVATGHKVERDLCGNACASADQKQRVYPVHCDDEFIWVDFPTESAQNPLPSDYYNQTALSQPPQSSFQPTQPPAGRQNYGLFGAAPSAAAPASPLAPYAGFSGWPVVPVGGVVEEPHLMLSQEAGDAAPSPPPPPPQQQQQRSTISFPAARPDPPHVARRKAATAAILARAYRPPTAAPTENVPVQLPAAQKAAVAAVAPGGGGARVQTTLFESWGRSQTAVGAENMMDTS